MNSLVISVLENVQIQHCLLVFQMGSGGVRGYIVAAVHLTCQTE